MEDGYSFFNYTRIELLRIGPTIRKSNTNSRRALEPGVELARTQERSGSVAEAPMLTMPKEHSRHGSALVVSRSYRA